MGFDLFFKLRFPPGQSFADYKEFCSIQFCLNCFLCADFYFFSFLLGFALLLCCFNSFLYFLRNKICFIARSRVCWNRVSAIGLEFTGSQRIPIISWISSRTDLLRRRASPQVFTSSSTSCSWAWKTYSVVFASSWRKNREEVPAKLFYTCKVQCWRNWKRESIKCHSLWTIKCNNHCRP